MNGMGDEDGADGAGTGSGTDPAAVGAGQRGASMARAYVALQALAGAAWWVGVFALPWVRAATLGPLDPVLTACLDVPLFVVASALVALGARWAVWVVVPWTLLVTLGLLVVGLVTGRAGWGVVMMAAASVCGVVAGAVVLCGRLPSERLLVGPFAFRSAAQSGGPGGTAAAGRPAGPGGHVVRTLRQMLGFWGLFLVVIPLLLSWGERRLGLGLAWPGWVCWLGVVVLVLASALGVWSALTMSVRGRGTPLPSAMPVRLVVAGPYRWVRNPMAVAGITQAVAVGLILGSWVVVVYALGGSLLWNTLVRPLEEADLASRFGADFDAYRRRVACWIPRWPTVR